AVKLINPGQPLVVRKAKPVSVQLRAETTKPAEVVGHPEGDPRGMRQVRTLQRAEGYDLRRRTVGYQLKMTKTGEPRGRPVPPPFGPNHFPVVFLEADHHDPVPAGAGRISGRSTIRQA